MRKNGRAAFCFALLGFGITIAGIAYQVFINSGTPAPTNWPLIAAFVVVCPVSLIVMSFFTVLFRPLEIGTPMFYGIWALVALLNAILYGWVGSGYTGLRRKPIGRATADEQESN